MSEIQVMSLPDPAPRCPQCGTPLNIGAVAGLCPACLLQLGTATDTVTDAKQPPFVPPTLTQLAPAFPQLEIVELIGKGGMGAVYKARQIQLDRLVALKILPRDIGEEAAFAERFAREAKTLARLNHPGIVTLYEFGQVPLSATPAHKTAPPLSPGSPSPAPEATAEPDRLFYFLMEFVDGVNLRQLLHASRLAPREALAIVPQICDALQYAHDQGIVHRDIKPENILVDRRGQVKVADFGLAKIVGREASLTPPLSQLGRETAAKPGQGASELTDAGKVLGTPNYMAPEQTERPTEVDHRADIYALGVVFYQMLTGELPGQPIKPPSTRVQVDVRLDEVVLRALAKQPELRYQQASLLKTAVQNLASRATGTSAESRASVSSSTSLRPLSDWRTQRTLLGWPLVHVTSGLDPVTGSPRVAKGIVAIGPTAIGVVAVGFRACGLVATGLFACGGAAAGLFSLGMLASGLASVGFQTTGLIAIGLHRAIGLVAMALSHAIGLVAIAPDAIGLFKVETAGIWHVLLNGALALAASHLIWKNGTATPRHPDQHPATDRRPSPGERATPYAIACLVILVSLLTWLASPRPQLHTLNGTVRSAVNDSPLPQVIVSVARTDDHRVLQQTQSGHDGRYRLRWPQDADLLYWRDGVRYGVDLVITASAPGYENRSVPLSQIQPAGPYARNLDFRLEPSDGHAAASADRTLERLVNEIERHLQQEGFQFDLVSTSTSGTSARTVLHLEGLCTSRPEDGMTGSNPTAGILIAEPQANGTWQVRGQQALARVQFTLDPLSAAWQQGSLPEPLPGRGPDEVADFSNQRIDEDAFRAALDSKPRLKRLDLHDSSISDDFLTNLAGLKHLEHLDLSSTLADTPHKPRLTDAGLRYLARLNCLRTLQLHGLPITDAGVAHLDSLPQLQRLQLGGTRVTTGQGLRGLKHLRWLRLDATPITDDALRHLAELPELEQLYLDGTAISDAGLKHLTRLPKLRVLNLHGTKCTADGAAALRLALPFLAVGIDEPSAAAPVPGTPSGPVIERLAEVNAAPDFREATIRAADGKVVFESPDGRLTADQIQLSCSNTLSATGSNVVLEMRQRREQDQRGAASDPVSRLNHQIWFPSFALFPAPRV